METPSIWILNIGVITILNDMNLLNEISARIDLLQKEDTGSFGDAFGHLQKAYEFFKNLKQHNSNEFNDVVYRTNQAYEGFLKEGATKLLKNDLSRKKTHEIEKLLTENKWINERIRKYIEFYRQNWRNDSTHDYKAVFNKSEALIAISSVATFSLIILNQVIDSLRLRIVNDEVLEYFKKLRKKFDQNNLDIFVRLFLQEFEENKSKLNGNLIDSFEILLSLVADNYFSFKIVERNLQIDSYYSHYLLSNQQSCISIYAIITGIKDLEYQALIEKIQHDLKISKCKVSYIYLFDKQLNEKFYFTSLIRFKHGKSMKDIIYYGLAKTLHSLMN